jgi:D-alanyl-D-alanine endopeptidase (penicillin-binding protein 7)
MRWFHLSLSSFLVTCGLAFALLRSTGPAASPTVPVGATVVPADAVLAVRPPIEPGWAPPDWVTEIGPATMDAAWTLGDMDGAAPASGSLSLASRSAFAFDLDSGEVLLEKRPDDPYPAASLTKLVTALTVAAAAPDLDEQVCITPEMWPGWPGASSKLNTGVCTRGWDLLGAALVKSDNRAAYALAHLGPWPATLFVDRMNEVAQGLGMESSSFVDPSGALDENLATARDLTKAVTVVAFHPLLGSVASAPFWETDLGDRVRVLGTTNKLAGRDDLVFLAAKTGYTDTARHCFAGVVETSTGRRIALTVLGAGRSSARWSDVRRIVDRFR